MKMFDSLRRLFQFRSKYIAFLRRKKKPPLICYKYDPPPSHGSLHLEFVQPFQVSKTRNRAYVYNSVFFKRAKKKTKRGSS